MYSSTHIDLSSITELIHRWLSQYVANESLTWLDQKIEQIAGGVTTRTFFTTFSAVPRYTGKIKLELTPEDLQAAQTLRPGWVPGDWSVDQLARTLILLALPHDHPEKYLQTLGQVFSTADVGELVALYQSLPLLPHPERHRNQAAEGVRSNITAVFKAVALQNPYPTDYFDNIAWNQMILKAIFVDSPVDLIQGIDRRANPKLAQMLTSYAHERWAAKRSVTPQLWRLVGRFADTEILADLEKVLQEPDVVQQKAAALACSECPLPEAQELLARYPELQSAITQNNLRWSSFSYNRLIDSE